MVNDMKNRIGEPSSNSETVYVYFALMPLKKYESTAPTGWRTVGSFSPVRQSFLSICLAPQSNKCSLAIGTTAASHGLWGSRLALSKLYLIFTFLTSCIPKNNKKFKGH